MWGGNAPGLREHATGSGCLLMPQERQGAINHQSSQGTGVPPRPSQSRPPGFSDNHTLTLSWPSVLPRRDWPTPSALLGIVPRDQHRRREGAIVLQLQTVCVTRPPAGQRAQGRDALAGPTGWGAGPAGGRGVSGETGSARVSPDSAGSEGRGGPSRAVRPGTDTHLSPESWPRSHLCAQVSPSPPQQRTISLGDSCRTPGKQAPFPRVGTPGWHSALESGQEAGAWWRRWARGATVGDEVHKPGDLKQQKCIVSQFRKSEPQIFAAPVPPRLWVRTGPRPPRLRGGCPLPALPPGSRLPPCDMDACRPV